MRKIIFRMIYVSVLYRIVHENTIRDNLQLDFIEENRKMQSSKILGIEC